MTGGERSIIVVSGLPRSGTSLMMQMLAGGGLELVTDSVRRADADNPRGYFEFEPVKRMRADAAWILAARGKAVKVISQLLYDLPESETYRVLLMERDMEEVLASQEAMLRHRNQPVVPRDRVREAFRVHLARLDDWLRQRPGFRVHRVSHQGLIHDPRGLAEQVRDFLGVEMSIEGMVAAVDPRLYRQRPARSGSEAETPSGPRGADDSRTPK